VNNTTGETAQERRERTISAAFEKDAKKTEYKTSALMSLAEAATAGSIEATNFFVQRAQVYATLELARVSGKTTPARPASK
jgi:hypothetical protein